MSEQLEIERDEIIRLHIKGTLRSVTRWITTHDQGIAELLKNSRRAYLPDRANVKPQHQIALLLLSDQSLSGDSRIGLLDVGGLTIEDVEKWSVWQDPNASMRNSSQKRLEETQGNGGKAYMYNLFNGPAKIIGCKDNLKNCKGFIGKSDSEERGTPGFIPNTLEGKNVEIMSFIDELSSILEPFDLTFQELPENIKDALIQRSAFTLVEGIRPKRYENKIPVEDLIEKIKKNPQALIPLENLKIYVFHNSKLLNNGNFLTINRLPPFTDFDVPRSFEIPDNLPDEHNNLQSTTLDGRNPKGSLILYTSRKDISKKLKYRWTITYRTSTEIVGTISVGEIIPPGVPASQFIYGEITLDALSPDYVKLGRDRPNEGPLLDVLNIFTSDKISELAKEINEKQKQDLDERILDEVHEENVLLDHWKNEILSEIVEGVSGYSGGGLGSGEAQGKTRKGSIISLEYGNKPEKIILSKEKLIIGRGVKIHLATVLKPKAKDYEDKTVPGAEFEWWSDDQKIARFSLFSDEIECIQKGTSKIGVKIKGTDIFVKIQIEVWEVKEIIIKTTKLKIPLGNRKKIITEVTNDEGIKKTDVLLIWKHNAIDQLIVRINPSGFITGNRLGKTIVYAGAGKVWAKTGSEIEIGQNPNLRLNGRGFPRLLITERDVDPETGNIRTGDPNEPALWQLFSDVRHNVWWINMQNPQSSFAFKLGNSFWRMFHAEKLVEMVAQVLMVDEFTQKGDDEEPKYWSDHKDAMDDFMIQIVPLMWNKLTSYVERGKEELILI